MKDKRYNKLKAWVLTLSLALLPLHSQAQEPAQQEERPLDKYLALGGANNPKLKALFTQYLAALEQIPQVGTLPDPQVTFGYFIQPIETRVGAQKATFSASQMFPWFGTLEAQELVAAQKAKVKYHLFHEAMVELYRDIRVTYNDLYYLQTATRITEENLEILKAFKELAQTYFETDQAGLSSVLQVEIEEEELRSRLEYLVDSKEPLVTKFEQLLNTDLEEPVAFPDSLWEEELLLEKEEIFQVLLAKNPRLLHMDEQAQVYEEQVKVAEKLGLPSFTLGGTYTNVVPRDGVELPDNGQDAIIFPQVGVKLPIYRKKYKAMQKEALLEKEAVQLRKENLENELLTELEQEYRDLLEARRRVALYKRLTRLAEESFTLLQEEFSTGSKSFEEVLRMERQLLNYRLELAEARTNLNNQVYNINYLMGSQYESEDR
ncbi:outer membrane protein TolC [Pontibacter ummariensis]|uniref:Outer membrane protein TolC n=1 Tax=Pontibacter ummariensis TaxID=1610492 RepID=A0A239LSD2_9BACT|nr:TolC family protein [Pontibacter ummariensis]PRY01413.1 outer membrane protein TolC [Pontibacter ummariensis]SNT32852.1 Outer membrane protein TolC [Pontibacter ummariensis]